MRARRRATGALLVAAALVVLGGCGGGDSPDVPDDAIAVVGDQKISKAEFDAVLAQAKASYRTQKREFPEPGSPEYDAIKTQAVEVLVQRAQFEQKAKELGIEVTEEDAQKHLDEVKKQYFGGDEKKYQEQLKQQNLTEEQVRRDLRAQLIQEALHKKVTADVKVSDKEVRAHYEKNKDRYGEPASRDVRHILVETRAKADRLYAQLRDGADFAPLAKANSKDRGSAAQGGKLTVAKGETPRTFEKLAFELDEGELAAPIRTPDGWHIVQAVGEVRSAKPPPFEQVEETVRRELLQARRNAKMTKWVKDLNKEFAGKIEYREGYAPTASTKGTTQE